MWLIATKEFRELLYNPKFLLTFLVSTVLILLSLLNGYTAYESEQKSATMGQEVAIRDAQTMESYEAIERQGLRISRFPEKMSIFSQGISGSVGRKSSVRSGEQPRAKDSRYSLDPILAVFGELDLTFTVSIILSLFALLFSYNAVSGEREAGTLQLMMSNSVRRTSAIIGKLLGGYLPLALLFLIPFLAGLAALLMFTGMNFNADEWLRIAFLVLAGLIYLLVFYAIGLATSALTRNSFVSFLLCLFVWVLSVAVIPRLAVQTAAQINPSMSIDEVESQILAYKNDRRGEFARRMTEYFKTHTVNADDTPNWFHDIGSRIRQEIAAEDEEFQDTLFDEFERKREGLLQTATSISRASPTSCFSFAANGLTNTDPRMLERFENDLQFFQRSLLPFLQEKQKELAAEGREPFGAVRIMRQADGKLDVAFTEPEAAGILDLGAMPRLNQKASPFANSVGEVIPDYAIMALYAICFFALAFVAFLRYDVR